MKDDRVLEALARLRGEFPHFAAHCLTIADKAGRQRPLLLNRAQRHVHARLEAQKTATGKVRALVLKGRQQGISTLIAARFYHGASLNFGQRAFIVAHEQKATDNLFAMVRRFHEGNPLQPGTGAENARELVFDRLQGGYKIATAGTRDVGRANTAQFLHGSEFAFWDNAEMHLAGLGNTVADLPGTEIILESTANGIGNRFHSLWQAAESGDGLADGSWQAIFVPWFWQAEYRAVPGPEFALDGAEQDYQAAHGLDLPQMAWRRNKLMTYGPGFEWLFDQEYPATPALAFQSPTADPLISPGLVAQAVGSDYRARQGPLVIGCDPAEFGDDRTAIVFRQGRVVFRVETLEKQEPMAVAGRLARYYQEFHPDALFVDRIGIGAGIVSRLKELNVPVIGVHSAVAAEDPELFANKRAEMWWLMREWFLDGPVRIPQDMALASDLSAPGYRYNSNGQRLLEKKEDMTRRGLRSPDLADALALTFAYPVVRREQGETLSGPYRPATGAGY